MVQLEVMQSDESRRGVESGDGGWRWVEVVGVKREMVLIKVSSLSVLVDKHFKKLCR